MSPKDHQGANDDFGPEEWNFPFEAELRAVSRGLHNAQSAWMAQIDSLPAPDRKTHELIRMVCTVIRRNPPGVARHAMLAAEVGATWEEVAGSIVLTEPAFGLLNVVEALPWARRGWELGRRMAPDGDGSGSPTSKRSGSKPPSKGSGGKGSGGKGAKASAKKAARPTTG